MEDPQQPASPTKTGHTDSRLPQETAVRRHAPARPEETSWQHAADVLRRWTTGIVLGVAAAILAGSLSLQADPPSGGEASTQESTVTANGGAQTGQDASSAQGEEGSGASTGREADDATDATSIEVPGLQGTLTVAGGADLASSEEISQLANGIASFEAEGYTLGFALQDLETGRSIRYRSTAQYYSASSIKAPFIIAGYEGPVEAGTVSASDADPLAQRALSYSDNDAYLEIRDLFGTEAFSAWLADAGVSAGVYASLDELAETHYPHLCPDQELGMWTHAYPYLSGGTPSAERLVSYIRARDVSPIKTALGSRYETWSKAGWIDFSASGGVEPATWDSGIVFSTTGTYVVAIGSDAPSDLAALAELVPSVDSVHDALVR